VTILTGICETEYHRNANLLGITEGGDSKKKMVERK
jgi:hypothetical protein